MSAQPSLTVEEAVLNESLIVPSDAAAYADDPNMPELEP